MWDTKVSWNEWRKRSTVDVADISVDQHYSSLLPELWDDETQQLELKKLLFYFPLLNVHNDDVIFYMMAKVNGKDDDTAWVVAIDMEHTVVEAIAPFSVGLYNLMTMHVPCVFTKYLNMTPGTGMANPSDKCFQRLIAKQCLMQVLWTLDWLEELDQWLEIHRTTYNTFGLLLQLSPVSSLRSNIGSMVEYASSCNGRGEAASQSVDSCLRALDDFELALQEPPSSRPASIEAMRSRISDVVQALDSILQFVPSTLMPKELALGEAWYEKRGKSKASKSRAGKHRRRKKKGQDGKGAMVLGHHRLLCFIGCLLILLIIVTLSSPWNVSHGYVERFGN